jgi:hypothetical protein
VGGEPITREIGAIRISHREAVATSSPTLPLRLRWVSTSARGHNPDGVAGRLESITQGSRNGNPGLEGVTALR